MKERFREIGVHACCSHRCPRPVGVEAQQDTDEEAGDDNVSEAEEGEGDLSGLVGDEGAGDEDLNGAVELLGDGDHHVRAEHPEHIVKEETDEEDETGFVASDTHLTYPANDERDAQHVVQHPMLGDDVKVQENCNTRAGNEVTQGELNVAL